MPKKGLLIVISGPSGCGKGTVCRELRRRHPEFQVSISVTTREVRAGEREGIDYFYRTKEQFEQMIEEGELLEHATIYGGAYYGTPKKFVRDTINTGRDVILEIDIQGALQVKERFDEGVFIFLVPPSMEELYRRLVERGRENAELIMERFRAAYQELNFINRYNYVVVNDVVETAVEKIEAIVTAEKCHVKRNEELEKQLLEGGDYNG